MSKIYKEFDTIIASETSKKLFYQIFGAINDNTIYKTLKAAEAAIPKVYYDNLYKWGKQKNLEIWSVEDRFFNGQKRGTKPVDKIKEYSVDEQAKMQDQSRYK